MIHPDTLPSQLTRLVSAAMKTLRVLAAEPHSLLGLHQRLTLKAKRVILLHYWTRRIGSVHQAMAIPLRVTWRLSLLVELWRFVRVMGPLRADDAHRLVEQLPPYAMSSLESVQMLLELGEQAGIFETFTAPGTDQTFYQARGHAGMTSETSSTQSRGNVTHFAHEAVQSARGLAELFSNLVTESSAQVHTVTSPRHASAEGLLSSPKPGKHALPPIRSIQFTADINLEQYESILESFQAFMSAELLWHQTQAMYEAELREGNAQSLLFRTHLVLQPLDMDPEATKPTRPGTS